MILSLSEMIALYWMLVLQMLRDVSFLSIELSLQLPASETCFMCSLQILLIKASDPNVLSEISEIGSSVYMFPVYERENFVDLENMQSSMH